MKSFNQILQYNFRLGRHTFIKRLLPHIAINHPFITESPEIGISRIFAFQCIIRKDSVETIDDAPIIGILCLAIHRFKIERDTSRTGIVFQEIVGSCVTEKLCQKALTSYSIPVASPDFSTENYRTLFYMGNPLFQFVIMLFNSRKLPVGRFFFTYKVR